MSGERADINLLLLLFGGATLVLSLAADALRRRFALTEPILAVCFGVLIGPAMLNVIDLARWGDPMTILEHAARISLAFAIMGAALRLPQRYFSDHARAMTVLLGPGMLLMWLASGLLSWWLLGVPFWVGMLLGAVVTPTDPVIAGDIVTGSMASKNIPTRIRDTLSAESGANDGAAYMLVFLPVLLLQQDTGAALRHWALWTVGWEIIGAVLIGALVGHVVGRWHQRAAASEASEGRVLLTVGSALALALLGGVRLAGSDGLLAVFVAGLAYSRVIHPDRMIEQGETQETINRLFTLPVFVLFGASFPWAEWWALGWPGIAAAAAIVSLRRLPAILALSPLIDQLQDRRDRLFYGWFGPIGIAAIFYATLTARQTGLEVVWPAASLVVAASLLAHGLTATPMMRRYGRLAAFSG